MKKTLMQKYFIFLNWLFRRETFKENDLVSFQNYYFDPPFTCEWQVGRVVKCKVETNEYVIEDLNHPGNGLVKVGWELKRFTASDVGKAMAQ